MSHSPRTAALCLAANLLVALPGAADAKGLPRFPETTSIVGYVQKTRARVSQSFPETAEKGPLMAGREGKPLPAQYDWFTLLAAEMAPAARRSAPLASPSGDQGVRPTRLTAESAPTVSSSPGKPVVSEAWFTGPIAAASAGTLPRGHVLLEPYLYDVRSASGDTLGSTIYLLYGLTDRVTVGVIPTFGSARSKGSGRPRRVGLGDASLTAQFQLHKAEIGDLLPTTSIVLQRVLPLGRFDRLGTDPDRGIGGGAPGTLIGLYTQRVDVVGSGRPLRTRVDLTYTFFGSTSAEGVSVYDTAADFVGRARPGAVMLADVAVEYSLSRRWAVAADFIYRRTGTGRITADDGSTASPERLPGGDSFSVAPAIEYNWSARQGVLVGMRWTARSSAHAGSITPVIAFNAVF